MKTLLAATVICGLATRSVIAQDILSGVIPSVPGNLQITNISDRDIVTLGLDVKSSLGGLRVESSDPLDIILLDTPTNVVVGNLGNAFELSSGATVETGIAFDGNPDSFVFFDWGAGFLTSPVVVTILPEPSSESMAWFAILGLLGLRRYHRCCKFSPT